MLALIAALFTLATRWEHDRLQFEFNQRVLTLAESMNREFDAYREALRAIERLFVSSDKVDRDEFSVFVSDVLARRRAIQALSWLPRVVGADRARFEASARAEGFESFKIAERNNAGALVAAASRPVYFPVFYIDPYSGNKAALGFDIGSNPTRLEALNRARDDGVQVATGRIRLVQETGRSFGFLIIEPIYRIDAATDSIEARRRNLVGYASGVFRIEDMIGGLITTLQAEDVDVWLYDRTASPDQQLFHAPTGEDGASADAVAHLTGTEPTASTTYDMAGRKWELRFVATPDYLSAHQSWTVWTVLVGAFLFASSLSGFLLSTTGRTARIEQVVAERTQEIQTQSHQLTSIIETMSQGLTVIGPDRRLVRWNDQYAQIMEMPEHLLKVGMTLDDLNHGAITSGVVSELEARKFITTFGSVHQFNAPHRVELTLASGRVVDLRRELTNDGTVFTTFTDITDQKNSETALEQRADELAQANTAFENVQNILEDHSSRLQSILDNISQGLTVFDKNLRLIAWNDRYEELLELPVDLIQHGVSLDTIVRRSVETGYFGPGEPDAVVANYFDADFSKPYRNDLLTPSGRILDHRREPMPDGGCVNTFTDITELKGAEEALSKRAGELARSNADLEQFAYVASHDLQEPLRMVASYCQLLQRRYAEQLDKRANDYIEFAVDGATRMKQLVDDLLAYSRAGQPESSRETISATGALESVLKNLDTMIAESQAQITYDELPPVHVRTGELTQIFQNLIGNAIKYRGEDLPTVHVSASTKNGQWEFSVADNGIGISQDYAGKVFQIFQRLHTKQEYPGTGIGLAICKKIIESNEGKIWFEPNSNGGSIFRFTLPI